MASSPLVPVEVVHLLLGPQPDDLAWVQFAESVDEAIVVFDVSISVLKLVERRLEHLQHHLLWNGLLLQAENTICFILKLRHASLKHFLNPCYILMG